MVSVWGGAYGRVGHISGTEYDVCGSLLAFRLSNTEGLCFYAAGDGIFNFSMVQSFTRTTPVTERIEAVAAGFCADKSVRATF